MQEIDDLDKAILRTLASDARLPALQLSQRLGKPASTVSTRIKALERAGIIQGYSALIDCQAFGYQSFQLFVVAPGIAEEERKRLFAYCAMHPHITFCIETVGKWNFEIVYEVESHRAFQEMLIEFRTAFKGIVQDVESIVLFDHYVKYSQYPFD